MLILIKLVLNQCFLKGLKLLKILIIARVIEFLSTADFSGLTAEYFYTEELIITNPTKISKMEVNSPPAIYDNKNDKTKIRSMIDNPNRVSREDSYDRVPKTQISKNLLSSLSTFNDQIGANKLARITSPSPVPIIPQSVYTTQNDAIPADNSDEMLAIQALGQLKNSETPPPEEIQQAVRGDEILEDDEDEDEDEFYDTSNDIDSMNSGPSNFTQIRSSKDAATTGFIMRNIKSHPLYSSAVRAYKINKPTIKYGVEMVERAAIPMVNMVEQTRLEWKRKKRLRRANAMFPDEAKFLPLRTSSLLSSSALSSSSSSYKTSAALPSISEALALGNKNLNEFGLNLSIESKKRIATCLQLLMLANKQLSAMIQHLQSLILKEQEFLNNKREAKKQENDAKVAQLNQEEEESNTATVQIKQEIVTTVKKVVSLISKYAGNSLPEPARSNVRETLLRLPTKWACTNTTTVTTPPMETTTNTPASASTSSISSSPFFNTNGKVLILANESLEMVSSVMSVFDETLAKAELWVRQKQEKQLAKAAILNNLQYSNTALSSTTNSTTSTDKQEVDEQEDELRNETVENDEIPL